MEPWLWEGSSLSLVEETNWGENKNGQGVASGTKWCDEVGVKQNPIIDLDVRDSMLLNSSLDRDVLLVIGNIGMQADSRIGALDTCYVCSEHPEATKIE